MRAEAPHGAAKPLAGAAAQDGAAAENAGRTAPGGTVSDGNTSGGTASGGTGPDGTAGERRGLPPVADIPVVRTLLVTLARLARRYWNALAVLIFAALFAATALAAVFVPRIDFDLLAYTAAVLEEDGQSAEDLHAAAYAAVQARSPERAWFDLRLSSPYRQAMWEDPAAFVSQLGMYRVKAGYNWLLGTVMQVTDPVRAAALINAGAVALIGVSVLAFMATGGAVGALPFAGFALMVAGLFSVCLSTQPDAISSVPTIAGLLILSRGRFALAAAVLALGVLLRADKLIVLFALLLASLYFGRGRIAAAAGFAAGCALAAVASAGADYPGWWPHLWFSVIELQVDMTDFAPPFSVGVYLSTLVEQVGASLDFGRWIPIAGLVMLGWARLAVCGPALPTPVHMAMVVIALSIFGKFIVFPLPPDRIYFALVGAAAVILIAAARPTLSLPRRSG
ncbi:hypothetical protein ATO13_00865 [Stappia sp. 22II-S9-Z10]|nr:hypothetical protein ATO13_00865 [Stappia sp. 22II-S9-Z10]